jgi:hypothetical protein
MKNISEKFQIDKEEGRENLYSQFRTTKKGVLKYRNADKTLTEKFVNRFTDKLQKDFDLQRMRDYELQLIKNKQQKSKNLKKKSEIK